MVPSRELDRQSKGQATRGYKTARPEDDQQSLGSVAPLARDRQHVMAKIFGVNSGGIASQLVIVAILHEPLQRILTLRPAELVARAHRGGTDRILQRSFDDRTPQLALGKSALLHADLRNFSHSRRPDAMTRTV